MISVSFSYLFSLSLQRCGMCKLRGLVVLVVLCVGPLQQASCVIWGRDGDDQGQVLPQELDYERDRSEMSQVPHNMKR